MPYSPIPKFPDIIQDLKNTNHKTRTDFNSLRVAIMRVTNTIKSGTIAQIIRAMEDLGYLKKDGQTWLVCKGDPYKFDDPDSKKIDKMIK